MSVCLSHSSVLSLIRNVTLSHSLPTKALQQYARSRCASGHSTPASARPVSQSTAPGKTGPAPISDRVAVKGSWSPVKDHVRARKPRWRDSKPIGKFATNRAQPKALPRKPDQEIEDGKKKEDWQVQKDALQRKFGTTGWNPLKKLSPDALEGIRALHKQQPDVYSTEVLANEFEVSPEAIRRILKSKWRPNEDLIADRRARWERRGERIWAAKAEEGVKPPKKWREALGIKIKPRDGTGGPREGLGPGSVKVAPGTASRARDPYIPIE